MGESLKFVHDVDSPRVIFGTGSLSSLQSEITLLGCKKIALICDESARATASEISLQLGSLVQQRINQVVMHVPDEFTFPIINESKSFDIDLVVAIGGGSSTGLGKIMALELNIPLLAIPTTYAGSEMTPIWGRTKENKKITGTDIKVLPRVVLYEPELTHSLPISISVNSGMNAIAHAVESLYSPELSPLVELAALRGIESMSQGLRELVGGKNISESREKLFLGSMLCGFTLGNAKMGLHHKICHTLGGMFNLPHAQMHSAVLPYSIKYNEVYVKESMNKVAEILHAPTASQGLWDLAREVGAETALKNLDFPVEEAGNVAEVISNATLVNPRPFEKENVVKLLKAAYNGTRPDDESW